MDEIVTYQPIIKSLKQTSLEKIEKLLDNDEITLIFPYQLEYIFINAIGTYSYEKFEIILHYLPHISFNEKVCEAMNDFFAYSLSVFYRYKLDEEYNIIMQIFDTYVYKTCNQVAAIDSKLRKEIDIDERLNYFEDLEASWMYNNENDEDVENEEKKPTLRKKYISYFKRYPINKQFMEQMNSKGLLINYIWNYNLN
jgi:hypothetical protein